MNQRQEMLRAGSVVVRDPMMWPRQPGPERRALPRSSGCTGRCWNSAATPRRSRTPLLLSGACPALRTHGCPWPGLRRAPRVEPARLAWPPLRERRALRPRCPHTRGETRVGGARGLLAPRVVRGGGGGARLEDELHCASTAGHPRQKVPRTWSAHESRKEHVGMCGSANPGFTN